MSKSKKSTLPSKALLRKLLNEGAVQPKNNLQKEIILSGRAAIFELQAAELILTANKLLKNDSSINAFKEYRKSLNQAMELLCLAKWKRGTQYIEDDSAVKIVTKKNNENIIVQGDKIKLALNVDGQRFVEQNNAAQKKSKETKTRSKNTRGDNKSSKVS